jgi:hypothetical protein
MEYSLESDNMLKRKGIIFSERILFPGLKEAAQMCGGGWFCFALRAAQDGVPHSAPSRQSSEIGIL